MGLISYIKGVYYDHRIEKADELLHNGKECEAEEIYKELLGKQYTAVNKLSKSILCTVPESRKRKGYKQGDSFIQMYQVTQLSR